MRSVLLIASCALISTICSAQGGGDKPSRDTPYSASDTRVGDSSTTQQPCLELTDVKAKTPPDVLYRIVGACVAQARFVEARRVFALAGLYSRFDAERVADKTASDAGSVLVLNTFSQFPIEVRKKFQQSFVEMTKDADAMQSLCLDVQRVGEPAYYPDYMIAHGIGHSDAPLLANFDAKRTWAMYLTSYLHCAQP